MTDAFLNARPEYRRAMSMRARPLPILAGEVAVLPRRRVPFRKSLAGSALIGFAGFLTATALIWALALRVL